MLGEIALVFSVIYHGVNALRIAAVDLWLPQRWNIKAQQIGVRGTVVVSVLLWLPAAFLMLKSMLEHNFGIVLLG
jgi:succinate dehydrogenase/fumarate reductase cytochrome b subunit